MALRYDAAVPSNGASCLNTLNGHRDQNRWFETVDHHPASLDLVCRHESDTETAGEDARLPAMFRMVDHPGWTHRGCQGEHEHRREQFTGRRDGGRKATSRQHAISAGSAPSCQGAMRVAGLAAATLPGIDDEDLAPCEEQE
ncbi:hypothetical protein [Mesorhizobium wenxiniae]|uniref:hypothetical protein n=1 Tax=Mesorhizobium wenxiniae TaxID=2014805 RepID=UPI00105540B5|nr:hypothetical protein [Mesorhizobium wenxiniae]